MLFRRGCTTVSRGWNPCQALCSGALLASLPPGCCGDRHQRRPLQGFGQALQVRGTLGLPNFAGVRGSSEREIPRKIMEHAGQSTCGELSPLDRTFCTEVVGSQALACACLAIQGDLTQTPWILMLEPPLAPCLHMQASPTHARDTRGAIEPRRGVHGPVRVGTCAHRAGLFVCQDIVLAHGCACQDIVPAPKRGPT